MAASIDRAARARNGSRRQRDLDALAEQERSRYAPPADITPHPDAGPTWTAALDAAEIPASPRESFIDPLHVLGERDGALCVGGPPRCAEWCRRRWGRAIADAIRERSSFTGLLVFDVDAPEPEVEPL